MRVLAVLACLATTLCVLAPAHAGTTAQVRDTWPVGSRVILGPNQAFYLLLHYHSDGPTRFWAAPYGKGAPLRVGTNTSRTWPAGDGEAIVSFFFLQPGQSTTGILVRAGDGSAARTAVVADYPVQVSGGEAPVATPPRPAWLERLQQVDKAARDAAYREAMDTPATFGDLLLLDGFMLLVAALGLFGTLGPVWGLWRWRGGWRLAATFPAALMAFVVLRLLRDTARDPTSHNLWPFEILQAGAISAVIVALLALGRRLSRGRRER